MPESAAEIALYAWLTAGALMLAVEALGVPGVGFLFAGLGAIIIGILLSLGFIPQDGWEWQALSWCLISGLTAIILYQPLKRWRSQSTETYSNMIGTMATVETPGLMPGQEGHARWSGALMRARLADGVTAVEEGLVLRVVAVEGTVLILA